MTEKKTLRERIEELVTRDDLQLPESFDKRGRFAGAEPRVVFGADGATVIFDDSDPAARRLLSGADIVTLMEEVDELQATFDLRWKADMRAIKRWREAHPGRSNVWPDHADLVVWLLEQLP